jgi:VIT1/CCC1 family predicted Fe2+/Mn2+ transporter
MLLANLSVALWWSIGVTLLTLFVFGAIKGRLTGLSAWRGGLQTTVTGGLAAAAAFAIARAFN